MAPPNWVKLPRWQRSELLTGRSQVRILPGSPRLSIDRTFRDVFHLPTPRRPLNKVGRKFRNPVFLAREWQQAIQSGKSINAAEIARSSKVSRSRVTQVLNLLQLSPNTQEIIVSLGDPLNKQTVTERILRPLVKLTAEEQVASIKQIIAGDPRIGARLPGSPRVSVPH